MRGAHTNLSQFLKFVFLIGECQDSIGVSSVNFDAKTIPPPLHAVCIIYDLAWAPQLSCDVIIDAGFLCYKASSGEQYNLCCVGIPFLSHGSNAIIWSDHPLKWYPYLY